MNYLNVYNQIIYDPKNHLLRKGEYEIHHIIPRSLGGNDESQNLVKLSYRAHFIVHHLLWRMSSGLARKKMHDAFWLMTHSSIRILNSFTYKKLRKERSKFISSWNKKRVEDGTNPFVGPENNLKQIARGKNPWVGPELNKKRWKSDYQNRCNSISKAAQVQIEKGTFVFQNSELQRNLSRRYWDNISVEENKQRSKRISEMNHERWEAYSDTKYKEIKQNMSKVAGPRAKKRWAKWRRDNNRPPKPGDENYL